MSAWERKKEADYERRQSRKQVRKRKIPVSWNGVPASALGLFIHLMVADGRAVLLGTTTDGDVLSVRVYEDGDKETFYIRNGQDIVAELTDIIDEYSESLAETFHEATTPKKAESEAEVPTPTKKRRSEE